MSDDELIRALEREREMLQRRGQAERAAEARRVASALRQAVWRHQVAMDEALRGDAVRDRWALVIDGRERARRFLESIR